MRTRKIREEKINDYYEGLKNLKTVLDFGQPEGSLTAFLRKNNMDGYAKEVLFKKGIIHVVNNNLKWNTSEPTRHMAVEVIRGVNLKLWHLKKKSMDKIRAKKEEKQTSFVTLKNLEHLSLRSIRDKKEQQLAISTINTSEDRVRDLNKLIQKSTPIKPTPKKEENTSSEVRRVINIVKKPVVTMKITSYCWGLIKVKTEYTHKWN